jgi:hypothetical protein
MLTRETWLAALVVALMMCFPGSAGAQVPRTDSVRGAVTAADGPTNPVTITFDVVSGALGENPSGSVLFQREAGFFHRSEITCLNVLGNQAVIGARIVEEGNSSSTSFLGWTLNYDVVDGGPGGTDHVAFDNIDNTGAPPSCAFDAGTGQQEFAPIVAGDLIVTDAPPLPATKEQCKNRGWSTYAVFKNQGDCVSFVATGGTNPPGKK